MSHEMQLSFTTPPLTANQRLRRMQEAKIVKQVRHEACVRAKFMRLPHVKHIRVELHYRPRDKRRRDADNIVPTLKALCDGLVDAGIVDDDTPEFMDKRMPIIHPSIPGEPGKMWCVITLV
ncbi:hypothetical protein H0194_04660 [Corynebacterium incognita]|uniref:Holliday junction resolvase n=1 Tax=Corynebacterium incognita TaxID=2754725 RepID=A0A7G7CRQ6_9CORY|nr:hypothetical protein [Corynebacterium incognita]QNE90272.1 hypothetical protein H0194_04660 [Corynebacterium incognita]